MLSQYHRGRVENYWKKMKSYPLHMSITNQLPAEKARPFPYCSLYNILESYHGPQNIDLVELLLSSGADCNLLDGQGLSPLHYAVWADDLTVARILLDSGADVNVQSVSERVTSLFCVVSEEMLDLLLSWKADPEIPAFNGDTVLYHFTSLKLHKLSLQLLSDSCTLNDVPNNYHMTPLSLAIQKRDETSIRILIDAGCDPRPEVLKVNERRSWIYTAEGERLMEMMTEVASNPRPLFDLCRFIVRNIFKKNIRTKVKNLPLPQKLKNIICLSDIAIVHCSKVCDNDC